MMVKRSLAAICGIATLSLSTMALANMSVPYGWYLEGNVGSTKQTGKTYGTNTSSQENGIGESAAVGYKFMPYFAGEFGYTNYANTDIKNSAGTKIARDRHNDFHLIFKGILPAAETGLEVFAKVGIERIASKVSIEDSSAAAAAGVSSSSRNATGLFLGAGAQYYFYPELALVVQWTRANGNNSTGNLQFLSAGLSFIFS